MPGSDPLTKHGSLNMTKRKVALLCINLGYYGISAVLKMADVPQCFGKIGSTE